MNAVPNRFKQVRAPLGGRSADGKGVGGVGAAPRPFPARKKPRDKRGLFLPELGRVNTN